LLPPGRKVAADQLTRSALDRDEGGQGPGAAADGGAV